MPVRQVKINHDNKKELYKYFFSVIVVIVVIVRKPEKRTVSGPVIVGYRGH